jgi:hypothetical protein
MKPVKLRVLLFMLVFLVISTPLFAQDEQVTVPDLTGLNIPQAAAVLNRNGLVLGNELASAWTEASGIPQNTIGQQSISAGSTTTRRTVVDVTLLRSANVTLIYDDNDLTLVNRDNRRVDFADLVFNTLQSSREASFQAARWAGRVRGGNCTQIWSIGRSSPKDIAGCASVERWLTTNNPGEHFWTAANGVQSFAVVQGGVERAICEAAPVGSEAQPKTCEFFLEANTGNSDTAPFVYFVYTTDQFVVLNRTEDRWMRLNRLVIHNRNPNNAQLSAAFEPGNPDIFGNPEILGRIQRLAPAQCLLFKKSGISGDLPEECDVISTLELPTDQAFWTFDFELQSISDDKRRVCRAATEGKLTICVLPR